MLFLVDKIRLLMGSKCFRWSPDGGDILVGMESKIVLSNQLKYRTVQRFMLVPPHFCSRAETATLGVLSCPYI